MTGEKRCTVGAHHGGPDLGAGGFYTCSGFNFDDEIQSMARWPPRAVACANPAQGRFANRPALNRQWRICFRWGDDGPYDVEMVDYH